MTDPEAFFIRIDLQQIVYVHAMTSKVSTIALNMNGYRIPDGFKVYSRKFCLYMDELVMFECLMKDETYIKILVTQIIMTSKGATFKCSKEFIEFTAV